ncbi:MAG TPA: alcohol dehydrogenase catalytic domain-containing protein [Gaiellaceae bacterium]
MSRGLLLERPGALRLETFPARAPGPGEVLLRPAYCGLCGTDLELLAGEVDPAFARYPLVLGHEWSGVVESVGERVAGLAPGMRCVAEGIIPCGNCASCRAGRTNVCEIYDEVGFTRPGGAADHIVVPAHVVHRLADGVALRDAALTEPTAVVLTGLEKLRLRPGLRVLVVGDGTIALLAVLLVSLWSPAEIAVIGRRDEQAAIAADLGATSFSTGEPDGGFDVAIEASGSVDAIGSAVTAVRRGGQALILGLPPTTSRLELPGDLLANNDLTVAGSFGYTSAAWSRVVELLNAGRLGAGRLVTHLFPLDDFEAAFQALARPVGERGKVMLEVAGG